MPARWHRAQPSALGARVEMSKQKRRPVVLDRGRFRILNRKSRHRPIRRYSLDLREASAMHGAPLRCRHPRFHRDGTGRRQPRDAHSGLADVLAGYRQATARKTEGTPRLRNKGERLSASRSCRLVGSSG